MNKIKPIKNKVLVEILEKIEDAVKHKRKNIVVFTTERSHHKENMSSAGVSVNDLKPVYKEAYLHLLRNYNVETELVNIQECAVAWKVKL